MSRTTFDTSRGARMGDPIRKLPGQRRAAGLRRVLVLLTLGVCLTPAALAVDPPHWSSTTMDIDCTSQCHVTHNAEGGSQTRAATNVTLCQSCHVVSGLAGGLPIDTADKAVPASHTGIHHAFDVIAVNPTFGTQSPSNQAMSLRVMDGNVVCSTCHDQHAALSGFRGTSSIGAAEKTSIVAGTGLLASGGSFTGAQATWYLVEMAVSGTASTARFGYSKDNGTSWFPTNCVPGTGTTAGCLTASGASPVVLDSGVEVTFGTGSYDAGERWQFYGSWPFLRAAMDRGDNTAGDAYCRDCHRSWAMDTIAVETWDGTAKSHPTGIVYPASDPRYRPTPLDGNWEPQGGAGADGNPTNDLVFDDLNNVQCTTCHGVHYADSNTLTVDQPR